MKLKLDLTCYLSNVHKFDIDTPEYVQISEVDTDAQTDSGINAHWCETYAKSQAMCRQNFIIGWTHIATAYYIHFQNG